MTYQIIEETHARTDWGDLEGGFAVYEIGTYERGSVLAGQTRKRFLDMFDSIDEAQNKFPKAEVHVGRFDANNTFNHLPDGEDY